MNNNCKRILLINSRTSYETFTPLELHYDGVPNNGLFSIAANLEAKGHYVEYLDLNYVKDIEKEIINISKKSFDYIGFSSIMNTYDMQLYIAKKIKKLVPNIVIVFGGTQAWIRPEDYIKHDYVDYVIRGLGELPFVNLVSGVSKEKIKGLCYKEAKKQVIKAPYFPSREELDSIVSMYNFSQIFSIFGMSDYILPVFTSYGCPFNCSFCNVTTMYGPKMLYRRPKLIMEEIVTLSSKADEIFFVDPNINLNKSHFMAVFSEIKRIGEINSKVRRLKFHINARVDTFDDEMLNLVKDLKIYARLGIESVTQRERRHLHKGGKLANMSEKELLERVDYLKKFVTVMPFIILITPITTKNDLIKNLKFVKNFKDGICEINDAIRPYIGTRYYEMYKESNQLVWYNAKFGTKNEKLPKFLLSKDKELNEIYMHVLGNAEKRYEKGKGKFFIDVLLEEFYKEFKI